MDSTRRKSLRSARLGPPAVVLAVAACVFLGVTGSAVSGAHAPTGVVVRTAQVLEEERTGVASPIGLAYSGATGSFYVVGAGRGSSTEVVQLEPFELNPGSDRVGSARLAATVDDPVNIAFDARRSRLLLLGHAGELLEAPVNPDGSIDPSGLRRKDAQRLGLHDPQGLTVDPASGTAFVLDAGMSRIVRVEPGPDGSFDAAAMDEISLAGSGVTSPRGLAFDPSSGHLYVRSGNELVELTATAEVVAVRDLSATDLASAEGMVFAPSGDQTDGAGQLSLYVADSGGQPAAGGQIVELSLAPLPAADAIDFTSSLVHTINTAAWNPPSPDPSGMAYLPPPLNRLMMVDGEVEETVSGITHFQGANVWEFTMSGSVLRTANISKVQPTVAPMTDEPTGVAFKQSTGQYFVSEDGGRRIYTLNPGGDGLVGTGDDSWTYFSTSGFGDGDPEGVTYDSGNDRLFVADGVNAEVYQYTLTGSLVGHFDVATYGVGDPETVEFNPVSGTLFTLSNRQSGPIIVETTRAGALIRTIDVSAMLSAGGRKPAGLAYGPASDGSGAKHFYVADRGVDNNSDPKIVDGKIFELTAPSSGAPTNQAPAVSAGPDQTITLPASASLNGTVSDDGLPNPPGALATTWSKQSGPGTVTFGTANAVDTTASFSAAGSYVLRLTANDGQLSAFDELTVTVNPAGTNQAPAVSAGPDQTITLPASASLNGTVTDDGLPNPPGAITTTWSKQSGPGTVTFGNANAVDTTASFSAAGSYVLRLTANDGQLSAFDELTVTVNPAPSSSPLYFSLRDAATVGGLSVANEDVVYFDGASFTLLFDGSDVGIGALRIDALARLDATRLLLSFDTDKSVAAIGQVDDSDIYLFTATSLGATTAGTFSLYFDGSDVGLTTNAHDVDALDVLGDGRLVLSTTGSVTIGSVSARDEDLLAFTQSSLGDTTAGSFQFYIDGSDVGLGDTGEDVNAVAVHGTSEVLLSTAGAFAVTGVGGDDEDVFVLVATSFGSNSAGTYSPNLFFDGSGFGLAANDIYAIDLPTP